MFDYKCSFQQAETAAFGHVEQILSVLFYWNVFISLFCEKTLVKAK